MGVPGGGKRVYDMAAKAITVSYIAVGSFMNRRGSSCTLQAGYRHIDTASRYGRSNDPQERNMMLLIA